MAALHDLWRHLQRQLFPVLTEELGELGEKDRQFVQVVALLPLGRWIHRYDWSGWGRPPHERIWMLHGFIAKAVYQFPTTEALIDALGARSTLRRLCGWESVADLPHAATFSRAFAQFAADELPQQILQGMVQTHCGPKLVGHISRDATAIEGHERPVPKTKTSSAPPPRYKRGRPKKGEVRPPRPPTRLEQQLTRPLAENLAELPRQCDIGCKTNSHGSKYFWIGYKLHLDVADGQIPISCVLTAASLNDTQVAVPLSRLTAQRVTNCYDLMDAGYDSEQLRQFSTALGHVPIIPGRKHGARPAPPLDPHQRVRFRERTAVERVYSRLKEEFGGNFVRVRGWTKVMAHLMFGILALTVDQILRLAPSP